jgi:hypothetical protein
MAYIVYTYPDYIILRVVQTVDEIENVHCPEEYQKKVIECPNYDPQTQKLKIQEIDGQVNVLIVDKPNDIIIVDGE